MNLERQHVLTKKEKAVMRVVYKEADKQDGLCLLTPLYIFSQLPLDLAIEESELDIVMKNLEIDEYFDLTRSEKKGELVYCINMKKKGLQFARVERAFKSNLTFRILLAVATGLTSAAVGWGLKLLLTALLNK